MVKKLFALASITALTGLMTAVAASGCSSTTTTDATADTGTGGGDAKIDTAKKDAPDTTEEAGAPVCPTTDPITAAEIEKQLTWLPPAAVQTVCTQADIDKLKALFAAAAAGAGVKYADIKTALGATCAACAFSPIKGPTWQVFVEDTSGAIDNRTGSCFAQLENADCGKKRFEWESCLDAACPTADCGDATKVQACSQKAQKGACKDLTDVYAKACPNETDQLPVCGNIFSAIAVSCSGGRDAGIDASTN